MPAKSETRGISFEELDKKFDLTEEKKQKIASFKGNPKLTMPIPGDRKTDKIIRPLWSKDDSGNPIPVREVKVDSPKVKTGVMVFMTVEDHEDLGVEYDMNYSASIHNEFTRFVEQRGLKMEDIFGKWFKLSAEEYDNKKYGESIAYRLRYMEDLNNVVQNKGSAASQF